MNLGLFSFQRTAGTASIKQRIEEQGPFRAGGTNVFRGTQFKRTVDPWVRHSTRG
jgi:hypothetical protein